jgi:Dodecin
MSVARVTELSATSETSFEDAINEAVARATRTLRAVVSAVGPPLRCLSLSIARDDSESPSRRRQRSKGAAVQYHCITL